MMQAEKSRESRNMAAAWLLQNIQAEHLKEMLDKVHKTLVFKLFIAKMDEKTF